MESRAIRFRESTISYLRFGTGPRLAICFHGYGEAADSFSFLEEYAGKDFSFISIDLPFHGKTIWNQGLNFSKEDLLGMTRRILDEEHFPKESRFSLLGYSLGGRMALRLYQEIPSEINKLLLFAPDGLKVNSWYWLATQTWAGNRLFALTMKYPGWFFGLLRMLNGLGMVNASIYKFVRYYIGDSVVRDLLYKRWTTLRNISPNLELIKKDINKFGTPVKLVYGKHDRIILSSVGQKFRKGIEGNSELFILHSGHKVLHEKHIEEILPILNS